MPRIKSATPAEAAKHPREFSILVNIAKDGEAPREVSLRTRASRVAAPRLARFITTITAAPPHSALPLCRCS
jgi:hypothetical protein